MYPLERWTRTSFVCLCLWVSLPFSMQHQSAADSNEGAHGVVSVIAASGGLSSLAMRGCASTNAPDAEGGVMAAREPKPAKNRVLSINSPTVHVVHKRSSRVCFCALTFELTSILWQDGFGRE